jgi:hypothetical protein
MHPLLDEDKVSESLTRAAFGDYSLVEEITRAFAGETLLGSEVDNGMLERAFLRVGESLAVANRFDVLERVVALGIPREWFVRLSSALLRKHSLLAFDECVERFGVVSWIDDMIFRDGFTTWPSMLVELGPDRIRRVLAKRGGVSRSACNALTTLVQCKAPLAEWAFLLQHPSPSQRSSFEQWLFGKGYVKELAYVREQWGSLASEGSLALAAALNNDADEVARLIADASLTSDQIRRIFLRATEAGAFAAVSVVMRHPLFVAPDPQSLANALKIAYARHGVAMAFSLPEVPASVKLSADFAGGLLSLDGAKEIEVPQSSPPHFLEIESGKRAPLSSKILPVLFMVEHGFVDATPALHRKLLGRYLVAAARSKVGSIVHGFGRVYGTKGRLKGVITPSEFRTALDEIRETNVTCASLSVISTARAFQQVCPGQTLLAAQS